MSLNGTIIAVIDIVGKFSELIGIVSQILEQINEIADDTVNVFILNKRENGEDGLKGTQGLSEIEEDD